MFARTGSARRRLSRALLPPLNVNQNSNSEERKCVVFKEFGGQSAQCGRSFSKVLSLLSVYMTEDQVSNCREPLLSSVDLTPLLSCFIALQLQLLVE